MAKQAIIVSGGKQYLVKENDQIVVDSLGSEKGKTLDFDTLAVFDSKTNKIDLGHPLIKSKVEGVIEENLKSDKIRVARFKAKSRYRKVKGYRHQLSKVKITKI